MKKYGKGPLLTVLVVVVFASPVAALSLSGREQTTSGAGAQERSQQEELPVAEYAAPESAAPEKRELRRKRGARFNMCLKNPDDARRFVITEETESSFGLPPTHMPTEPALPTADINAVVLAEVTDAQAFLSADKTDVYSEFALRLEEVCKNNAPATLAPGGSVTAARAGGGVRFLSGKVMRRTAAGKA